MNRREQPRIDYLEIGEVEAGFVQDCLDDLEQLGMYQPRGYIESAPEVDLDFALISFDPIFTGGR